MEGSYHSETDSDFIPIFTRVQPDENHRINRPDSYGNTIVLQQIADILQNSTIANESGKDPLSKFWGTYKNVAGEYDDDMLERCNGNMDIVLIFAGLFSAVNAAFIISMRSSPSDTTNVLLVQLIQITLNGTSAAQPILSPSTAPNSWTQALGYASLAFSLLAAFGAVMAKQWLGYYKTNRYGRGSLQSRCQQRQRKFQELKLWRFENVLQSFPVLLQISLLLFGLSLGAMMWTQQRPISILILATTAFGCLFHAFTVLVSLICHDSPFQTPISLAIQAVFCHFRAHAGLPLQYQDEGSATSAMEWILETSANPDVVRSVVELMPTMPTLPNVNLVLFCTQVRDMFEACFDRRGVLLRDDNALAYGKALVYFSWNNLSVGDMLRESTQEWNLWQRWHAHYLPHALEQCRRSYRRIGNTIDPLSQSNFREDTRVALRMAVAAGIDEFAHPDDTQLVWDGRFRIGLTLPEDFDWLLDCAEHFYKINNIVAAGDALLLFSGMQKRPSNPIQGRIAPFFNDTQSNTRFRHIVIRAALRVVDYENNSPCDHSLSCAVLKAICPLIPDERDQEGIQITDAVNLLNFTEWPAGSDLAISPLPKIQLLVLLVLPPLKIDNLARFTHYCRALIRYMGADQPYPLRAFASNIVCSARQDLAMVTTAGADESSRDLVLSEFCPALLTALFTCSDDHRVSWNQEYLRYYRLAFALAKSSDWHPHLTRDGYIERWITHIHEQSSFGSYSTVSNYVYPNDALGVSEHARCLFYLAGISLRIAPPEQAASYFGAVTTMQWWDVMRGAWHAVESYDELDDGIESLAALVKGTEWHMPSNASKNDLGSLNKSLGKALDAMGQRHPRPDGNVISAVEGLKDIVCGRLEVAESSVASSVHSGTEPPGRRPRSRLTSHT